jgi:tetratricopeptide (TPR) repeat protein
MALKKAEREYFEKEKTHNVFAHKKQLRNFYYAVAASVVLAIGIFGVIKYSAYYPGKNYEDIFYQYYQPYPISYQSRNVQDDTNENLIHLAVQAYENKEFYKAITLFSNIETSIPDCTLMAAFYKGVACIEISDYKNAIQSFNKVIVAPYNTYTANAHWYIALTWLKLNNVEESKKHLSWLINNDRQLNTKAEEILQTIEK